MNNQLVEKSTKSISVAPMMDWTDRHCRYFHRLISPNATLFTEMITTGALLYGDHERFLRFNKSEHTLIIQLGGSDPKALAQCAKMAEDHGYDGVNLNCGCPSDRVQSGRFGASLMKDPALVGECLDQMINAASIPVSVKCRIGIDDCDELSFLNNFLEVSSQSGCKEYIIHARKALLNGLSPKENREIPPLKYDIVQEMKKSFPDLTISLNGGISEISQAKDLITQFDGIMIGRKAYQDPYFLAEIERTVFNNGNILPREDIALAMIHYIKEQGLKFGTPEKSITRHMMGLFHGQPGGRKWRQALSERYSIAEALAYMNQHKQAA